MTGMSVFFQSLTSIAFRVSLQFTSSLKPSRYVNFKFPCPCSWLGFSVPPFLFMTLSTYFPFMFSCWLTLPVPKTLANVFFPSLESCLPFTVFIFVLLTISNKFRSKSAWSFRFERWFVPCNPSTSTHCCSCPWFPVISTLVFGRSVMKFIVISGRFIVTGLVFTRSVRSWFLINGKWWIWVFMTRLRVIVFLIPKCGLFCWVVPFQPSTLHVIVIV